MKKALLRILIPAFVCALLAGCGMSGKKEKAEDASFAYADIISQKKQEMEENAGPEAEKEDDLPEESGAEDEETEDEAPDESIASLRDQFVQETGEEPAEFVEDDFDGDGETEAFALIGEESDNYDGMRVVEGSVFYVTKSRNLKLLGPASIAVYDEPRTMTMGDTTYVLFDEVYTTALLTYVWSVENGKAVEAPFSALGEVLADTPDGEGRFRILDDEYDCMYDPASDSWMGHSWKNYYFFYNSETKEVEEYAGTEIDRDNVEFLCGRDLVGDLVPKGARVDSLFCRGNGMIVINFAETADGCVYYSHIIYDFTDETFVDDFGEACGEETQGGICREALCPQIANYPQVPNAGW